MTEGKEFPISGWESVQGRRWNMEDTHIVIDDVRNIFPGLNLKNYGFYGVFDGHGGKECSLLCEQLLHKNIFEDPALLEGNIEAALESGFLKTDEQILKRCKIEGWSNGSTAVVSLISKDFIYVANTGDSEAVLAKKTSEGFQALLLSEKHKPNTEKTRIENGGGHVIFGRILGSLAVSRSLGDIEFKYPFNNASADFVSAHPFISKTQLCKEDEFLILACDGLWDKLSYQEAVDFVVATRSCGKSASESAELIVKNALDRGTLDNVTAIIIYLR